MPLPEPACSRQPIHTRSIRAQSYAREDGLWDIEAELIDTKAYDFPIRGSEIHPAGAPVHHMHLRVTIDDRFNITDAEVVYDAAPYGEFCAAIAPEYRDLVGLNLLNQFRRRVRERFARTAGCTHVTELTGVLPTVAIQTMAARRRQAPAHQQHQAPADEQHQASADQHCQAPAGERPFQLDGCHALRLDGPVVKTHYAPWYAPTVVDPDEGRG